MIKKIIKIGGTIFTHHEQFNHLIHYLNHIDDSTIIVISAFGKSTQVLRKIAYKSKEDFDEAELLIDSFFNLFNDFAKNIGEEFFNEFVQITNHFSLQLKDYSKGINLTNNLSLSILDKILSYGEIFSFEFIKLICKYNNISSIFLDARELIITNSDFGNAKPIFEICERNLNSKIASSKGKLYFIQGFIASNQEGLTTTMGFESSNLTATILAKTFNINQIEIITDVEGIRDVDPKRIFDSKPIHSIDYNFAYSLAESGLNLLFKDMILIAETNDIKIKITNLESKVYTYIYKDITCNEKMLVLNTNKLFGCIVFESLNHKIKIQNELTKFNLEYFSINESIFFSYSKGFNFKNFSFDFEKVNDLFEISIFNTNKYQTIKILEIENIKSLLISNNKIVLVVSTSDINSTMNEIYEELIIEQS
jgi:aspartate kinase